MVKKIFCLIMILILSLSCLSVNALAEKSPRDFKTNGNGGKTDVGTWYCTYNNQSMFYRNFGSAFSIKYRSLMPDGDYGILDSSVVEYVDFQLKHIADAKIDFILFDNTNGGFTEKVPYGWLGGGNNQGNRWIVQNSRLVCERIAVWNKNNDWQIRYAHAIGAYEAIRQDLSIGKVIEYQAEAIYKDFYQNKTYGKDYYTMEGKPLLVVYHWAYNVITDKSHKGWNYYTGTRTYGDKFMVRPAQLGQKGTYGWDNRNGPNLDEEVVLLSPGHATHQGDKVNVSIHREQGQWYRTGWETVLNNTSPRIVMLASFNDYHENTVLFITDTSTCEEKYDEVWYDVNGNLNRTMYWDMTKEAINKLRVKNGDNIKGLDKSIAVADNVYISIGEGIAKEPKEGAVKTTNIKIEKPINSSSNSTNSSDNSSLDNSISSDNSFENNSADTNTDSDTSFITTPNEENQTTHTTNTNNNSSNTRKSSSNTYIILIVIIATVLLIAAVGLILYFAVFKKKVTQ